MAFVDWVTAFGTTTSTDDLTIEAGDEIEISTNVVAGKVTIETGGILRHAPAVSADLQCWGNFVVEGTWRVQPASVAVQHTVTMKGVDPETFIGGGTEVLDTDPGIWVRPTGVVTISGPYRKPWIRTTAAVSAGATSFTLESAPTGWQIGDEIVLTPTEPPTVSGFATHFDERTILNIAGNVITVAALTYDHPLVDVGDGILLTTEVLNLTRQAIIRGEAGAESHIHLMFHDGNADTRISQLRLDHMGPRRAATGADPEGLILGRYPLHFHHGHEDTRGILIDGVVATNSRNRAFVPHMSNGVYWRGCIAHDIVEDAYWWDMNDDTNDITYDRCVASKVAPAVDYRGYRLAGFTLRSGTGNAVIGCVATGVLGKTAASGFNWPEMQSRERRWDFEDSIGHNNLIDGIFVWQNDSQAHVVDRFVGYHNGQAGIEHGAYNNKFLYRDNSLFGNGDAAFTLHSHGQPEPDRQTLQRIHMRGDGISEHGLKLARHVQASRAETLVTGCIIEGHTAIGVGPGDHDPTIQETGSEEKIRFEHCEITSTGGAVDFYLESDSDATSLIRVDPGGAAQAFELRRFDQSGTLNAAWNTRVTDVADFAAAAPAAFTPIDMTVFEFDTDFEDEPPIPPGPTDTDAEPLLLIDDDFTGASGAVNAANWTVTTNGSGASAALDTDRLRLTFPGTSNGYAKIHADVDPFLQQEVYATHIAQSTTTNLSFQIRLRESADGLSYYALHVTEAGAGAAIRKVTSGTIVQLTSGNYRVNAATAQRIRFRAIDDTLQLKIWNVGDTEPAEWEVEYVDPAPFADPGGVSIAAVRSSPAGSVLVDDVEVWDLDPPTVPVISITTEPSAGDSPSGWRTADVTITATADQEDVEIEYSLDGTTWLPYTVPLVSPGEGPHHYEFRGTNVAGTGDILIFGFQVDTVAPTSSADAVSVNGSTTITLTGEDPNPDEVALISGLSRIAYSLDGGAVTTYTAPIVVTEPGDHTLSYYAEDIAGNLEEANELDFEVIQITSAPIRAGRRLMMARR